MGIKAGAGNLRPAAGGAGAAGTGARIIVPDFAATHILAVPVDSGVRVSTGGISGDCPHTDATRGSAFTISIRIWAFTGVIAGIPQILAPVGIAAAAIITAAGISTHTAAGKSTSGAALGTVPGRDGDCFITGDRAGAIIFLDLSPGSITAGGISVGDGAAGLETGLDRIIIDIRMEVNLVAGLGLAVDGVAGVKGTSSAGAGGREGTGGRTGGSGDSEGAGVGMGPIINPGPVSGP